VLFEAYFRAQGLFGIPRAGQIDYSRTVRLDLASIVPSLAGPKRPQDRIALPEMASRFNACSAHPSRPTASPPAETLRQRYPTDRPGVDLGHGDVLIAAITSCTNTSNPAVMIAAGLLAKKAVAKGLRVQPHIKTSLAPGSRVVTDYLEKAGLLAPLAELGFALAGYGCTTCIGNAGDLDPAFNQAITEHQLSPPRCSRATATSKRASIPICAPITSLRRRWWWLLPLPAGSISTSTAKRWVAVRRPAGLSARRLAELGEIDAVLPFALDPETFRRRYADVDADQDLWKAIPAPAGEVYDWPPSTYIARPPFFELPAQLPATSAARARC
jgi:aconitate hydratase